MPIGLFGTIANRKALCHANLHLVMLFKAVYTMDW
ncbi:hypothetical protein QO003_001826 [Arthrobacter silviterrae]|nr:hypothetical protein [Arthrobacter silviterrae]